jgi:hypothetical protein
LKVRSLVAHTSSVGVAPNSFVRPFGGRHGTSRRPARLIRY